MKRERREGRERKKRGKRTGKGKKTRGRKISSNVTAEEEEEEEKRGRKSKETTSQGRKREQQEATEMAAGMLSQPARGEESSIRIQGYRAMHSDAQRCEAARPGCHEPYSRWVPAGRSGTSYTSYTSYRLHTTPASSQSAPARASSGGKPHSAVDRILLSGGVCSSLLALGKGLVCRSVS